MLKRPEPYEPRASSATVLVVDDAATARLLVTQTLQTIGFTTLVATDGIAALATIRCRHPDAIITDLEMPGLDGLRMIKAIRADADARVRCLPIVVCSSKTDAATLRELDQLGVDAVVSKPVDVAALARTALTSFKAT